MKVLLRKRKRYCLKWERENEQLSGGEMEKWNRGKNGKMEYWEDRRKDGRMGRVKNVM